MCGQFDALTQLSLLKNIVALREAVRDDGALPQRIVPTGGAPILIENPETGAIEQIPARFGLIPSWYRGALAEWKASTFNARLEEASIKPVFKGAWRYRRCIVPATAFYEWSGPKSARRRWRVTRADNQPLAFAGLWDEAYLAEGEIWSFAILTRGAGSDMQAIHDREPVVLPPEDWTPWLKRQPVDLRARAALRPVCEDSSQEITGSLL
ncbi:SOS response-associated peptidase [Asticcacaulis sp. EMRT-3]|uniref:SOS response-associated peptidase n=1 Tax=Asticcacaulis sp. EMRT-3 TaxID=3040349 RepID=UPI0024AF5203|nr:SOS response-associated peptidase [Asticcacaulis sp. EMRT-3]MDI7775072.1 SOS response-associated peptidase [Asticcacaulis sp. EMRT-3]